jgi:hypothetical protein
MLLRFNTRRQQAAALEQAKRSESAVGSAEPETKQTTREKPLAATND